jgi:hypothetical protein
VQNRVQQGKRKKVTKQSHELYIINQKQLKKNHHEYDRHPPYHQQRPAWTNQLHVFFDRLFFKGHAQGF